MNIKKTLLTFIIAFTSLVYGQFSDPVSVSSAVKDTARAGEIVNVEVAFTIDRGWHIYGMEKIEDGPIPTSIEIIGDAIQKVGTAIEPEPDIEYDEGFEKDIPHHSGYTVITVPVLLKTDLQAGIVPISVTATYQSCDNTICYPPFDQTVEGSIPVQAGEPREGRDKFIEEASSASAQLSMDTIDDAIQRGFWSFVLLAASMGFLALLTPCVFPMIPITVSFFTQQGENSGKSPISNAFVYATGIVVTFTLLGVLLAVILGASGANQLAASPWVNLFIGGLFIFFALSLFGMYEIQVPEKLRRFSMEQEKRSGYIGVLFMALTFTLASFTCTVQFVGLLLVAAAQGQWFWPVLGMLIFSSAFALPFFFLAMFPQYLAKLPKSGGWLNVVKVVMGFMVFAVAFKFISNVDLVWGLGIFTYNVVLAIWTVTMIFTGIYLLGKIRLTHDSPVESLSVGRMLLSLFFFAFGIYLGTGLFGRPLNGTIESYLPPKIESGMVITDKASLEEVENWYSDMESAIAGAKRSGKLIFINFSGYTCTNCHWMEANILSRPEVKELLNNFVLVKLYTDGGENYRAKRQYEIDKFGTAAQPFYAIINAEENEIARFPGLTRNVEKFIDFLNKGL